jgi:hypothetical protein
LRALTPELLDILPAADPRAMHSLRDLVLINRIMRQSAIMARALRTLPPPRTLADLGGGDGRFLLAVARRLAKQWSGVTVLICDRQNIVAPETCAAFQALGWNCEAHVGDVFDGLPQADIITANLFLHHFDDAALTRLLAAVAARTNHFAACEPRRGGFALTGARLVGLLGCNDVTRHDAVVSVQAGFAGQELSGHWPRDVSWSLDEGGALPFTHVLRARRHV